MALELKANCERCHTALAPDGSSVICSFGCTFCPTCAVQLGHVCPNCGGELVLRPRLKA